MASQDELRELLTELITERRKRTKESLDDFGEALARLIGPNHKPYSKQHIKGWQSGRAHITEEAAGALTRMAALVFDDASELQAQSRQVTILAWQDIPDGAQWGGSVRYCVTAGCGLPFLPTNYFQRYCPKCQMARKVKPGKT